MPARGQAQRVIDFHVHIQPWHTLRPEVAASFRAHQPDFDRIQAYAKDPARFVARLDEEGIERACLINYPAPEVMGFPPEINRWIYAYTRGHRDRLVPFGGIHPLHTQNPKRDVETLLSTYELGGIKIQPPHQLFFPNDYEIGHGTLRILYEACERAGVPVMIHTGTSIFPGARNRYGDPMPVDDVAVDFPKLKIILAHGGRPLWMDTATFLVRRHPNVHMDISGVPPKALLEYFPKLESLAEKVLYGSDWPGPRVPGLRANADAVAKLPLSAAAKRRILYENARRILR